MRRQVNCSTPSTSYGGFTIVEFVVVIILLGVLSTVTISRMVSPSAFGPGIVAQTLVAQTRTAQQRAASRNDAVITLTVDELGSDWRFQLSSDLDGILDTELVERANTTVQAQSGAANAPLGAGAALNLEFDSDGNLADVQVGAAAGTATLGVELVISGDSNRNVCVYSTGYAVAEPCA